ncbi:2-octaprenyl-6-methoxyphenol hydroxylase [Candidatus Nitrotoga sp. HW29]|uniref:FAD-dependent monooxygenase n=1 Tax=Candidatus Nitrotoga sp. HW29 TaxID=2886963 RepID=UPI001EF2442A|nr:FAD-dependent monooxygenase [Candidatus Nitrotoga sp. HW29]CAH1903871.1 2-octaprenyl-6-methoxyphenol hydroxylase [Candidatus Nitrotoga sp. HW29]
MNAHCDIAIIGGGPVGTALMLALRDSGLQIVMLEARAMEHASADPRALALSSGSRQLLERLGVWKGIAQVSLIKTIHVSQKNSFGRTLLRAEELKVPELGYVLPYTALQNALQSAVTGSATRLTGATVTHLQSTSNGAFINYQHAGIDHQLEARLAVVADGGKLLEAAYPPEIRDYGQTAVIAHVTCTHPQPEIAFERFTMQGPLALLPFRDGYELVWTASHEMAQEILHWNDAALLAQLHQHFGDRAGKFLTIGKRACFPLRLKRAPKITLPHTVLIGNAAQTLHPVAGQGFNMGLRDAWGLAQEILNCEPETLGSEAMLTNYRKQREFDRQAGIHFTDGLVRLFSNDLLLLKSGRAAALTLLDCLPGVKKFVAKRMMFGTNG